MVSFTQLPSIFNAVAVVPRRQEIHVTVPAATEFPSSLLMAREMSLQPFSLSAHPRGVCVSFDCTLFRYPPTYED